LLVVCLVGYDEDEYEGAESKEDGEELQNQECCEGFVGSLLFCQSQLEYLNRSGLLCSSSSSMQQTSQKVPKRTRTRRHHCFRALGPPINAQARRSS
jgi:hypothetical protein